LPKKTYKNYNTSIDFNKQTNRIKIEDMTYDVNESRFEMIDKKPEVLSTLTSPKRI